MAFVGGVGSMAGEMMGRGQVPSPSGMLLSALGGGAPSGPGGTATQMVGSGRPQGVGQGVGERVAAKPGDAFGSVTGQLGSQQQGQPDQSPFAQGPMNPTLLGYEALRNALLQTLDDMGIDQGQLQQEYLAQLGGNIWGGQPPTAVPQGQQMMGGQQFQPQAQTAQGQQGQQRQQAPPSPQMAGGPQFVPQIQQQRPLFNPEALTQFQNAIAQNQPRGGFGSALYQQNQRPERRQQQQPLMAIDVDQARRGYA